MMKLLSYLTILSSTFATASRNDDSYGLDCSFPIHSKALSCGDLLGDRQGVYDNFMDGCRNHYGEECNYEEDTRIAMNIRQPQSMVVRRDSFFKQTTEEFEVFAKETDHVSSLLFSCPKIKNFTSGGFRKIRTPESLQKLLTNFWEKNKEGMEEELWSKGSIYTNHWEAPTYLVSVENSELEGGGYELREAIWDAARDGIEDWTTMKLRPSSLYGIRVYTEGAILNPHVDRMPLVSSAIVNVAQDVDEDWPIEVYDRFGKAVNITMQPGDMVLYESGSLVHGVSRDDGLYRRAC
jgi:hypothetical protein